MKIIKVSTELEMSVHEFPEGTMREQNKVLYGLIGNGCDLVEHVMPKRLYTELKMPSSPVKEPGKCVSMLIDEEGRLKPNKANLIGSYLYEFDKHGCPIVGNILFLERLENIDTMRGEISTLNNGIAVAAGRADCYEALKQAFSQDGVPHQIIRNIIPHITDTTNNILGQMTGGTMGVEFVMERTVKGKDGDKATLDVLINEYGKTTLPFLS